MSDATPAWAAAMESRLQASTEAMEGRLLANTAGIESRLQASAATLRGDVMPRLDRLQNARTPMRDDISVNFAAVGAVRRANDNTRDEVRALGDVVTAMGRQITRIQTELREIKGEPRRDRRPSHSVRQ